MPELFESHETAVDLAIERGTGIGSLDPAAVAREKRQSRRRLQLCNQAADARLRGAEFFGRGRHRSPQHHQPECFDLFLVHVCRSPSICPPPRKLVISKLNSRRFWPYLTG